jgi:hypothetical protein
MIDHRDACIQESHRDGVEDRADEKPKQQASNTSNSRFQKLRLRSMDTYVQSNFDTLGECIATRILEKMPPLLLQTPHPLNLLLLPTNLRR